MHVTSFISLALSFHLLLSASATPLPLHGDIARRSVPEAPNEYKFLERRSDNEKHTFTSVPSIGAPSVQPLQHHTLVRRGKNPEKPKTVPTGWKEAERILSNEESLRDPRKRTYYDSDELRQSGIPPLGSSPAGPSGAENRPLSSSSVASAQTVPFGIDPTILDASGRPRASSTGSASSVSLSNYPIVPDLDPSELEGGRPRTQHQRTSSSTSSVSLGNYPIFPDLDPREFGGGRPRGQPPQPRPRSPSNSRPPTRGKST